ncbi:MAG: porin, partial [Oxalobacter sp.]|nr:porin [Oxalobacter sp.]
TGYVKKTGQDTTMDENVNSRIGFKGVEDLGDGLKATFQLEKRFDVGTGENNSKAGKDWEGASNVGLKGDDWGWVRGGRMNGIATENIRKVDPFYQYGIGSMVDSPVRGVRRDRMLRYDSPEWAGFSFQAAYELGRNMNDRSREVDGKYVGDKWYKDAAGDDHDVRGGRSAGRDNDGYQVGLNYKNGGLAATANWQMLADTNRSTLWNVGVSYAWDTVKLEALYQKSHAKDNNYSRVEDGLGPWTKKDRTYYADDFDNGSVSMDQALIGLEWKVGPGRLNASAEWINVQGSKHSDLTYAGKNGHTKTIDSDCWKVNVGYTYNLSKRTSLYGVVSYADWDKPEVGDYLDGISQDSTTGVQLGITHKF